MTDSDKFVCWFLSEDLRAERTALSWTSWNERFTTSLYSYESLVKQTWNIITNKKKNKKKTRKYENIHAMLIWFFADKVLFFSLFVLP